MEIQSKVEKKRYLQCLKEQMESPFAFGETRFTGTVLGSFLYITHHAGHEFNRKVTNEKSRTIGFVTRRDGGCAVHAIFTWGYLDPISLVSAYLIGMLLTFLMLSMETMEWINPFAIPTVCWGIAAAVLFFGVISYVQCWFTQRGQESMRELTTLLENPVAPWEEME